MKRKKKTVKREKNNMKTFCDWDVGVMQFPLSMVSWCYDKKRNTIEEEKHTLVDTFVSFYFFFNLKYVYIL